MVLNKDIRASTLSIAEAGNGVGTADERLDKALIHSFILVSLLAAA